MYTLKKKSLLIYIKNILEGNIYIYKYSKTNTPNRPTYQDFIFFYQQIKILFYFL